MRSVRQLVFHGTRRLSVEEASPARIGSDDVRVSVHAAGVCGSDVHGYAGVNLRRQPGMVMGHEAVGTIAEVGANVAGLDPGTPVTVNPVVGCGECVLCAGGEENLCERRRIYGCVPGLPGAFAETLVVRASNVVPFRGDAPFEWGALVEPLSVGAHAVRIGGVAKHYRVLVVGGGPIGLGAALAARRRGASVVLSEPNSHRRDVAAALGFETLDPSSSDVPRSSFAVALECVGHPATLETALVAVPPKGLVVFVGLAEETVPLPATPLMVGERRIIGSSTYTNDDFRDVADWIASRAEDLSPLIERRVDLDALPGVFDAYADSRLDAVKTLLRF